MKTIYLSLVGLSFSLLAFGQIKTPASKVNGWYHIIAGQTDSISREPIVTVKDFVDLRIYSDEFGHSVISGKVSEQKRNLWAEATEKSIGQRIGFVFNDTVITDPQVNARIESGSFQISLRHGHHLKRIYRQLLEESATDSISVSPHLPSSYILFNQEKK